jgi:hypothetical protein
VDPADTSQFQYRTDAELLTDTGAITASSTDTLTNKTFDANGTGNSLSNVEGADIVDGTITRDDVEAELRTEQFCFVHANPDTDIAATEDFDHVYMNISRAFTITQITCSSDDGTGSPTINLELDGDTAEICTTDITCGTTPTDCGTVDAAEDNVAVGSEIDYKVETVTAGLRRISVCVEYTVD